MLRLRRDNPLTPRPSDVLSEDTSIGIEKRPVGYRDTVVTSIAVATLLSLGAGTVAVIVNRGGGDSDPAATDSEESSSTTTPNNNSPTKEPSISSDQDSVVDASDLLGRDWQFTPTFFTDATGKNSIIYLQRDDDPTTAWEAQIPIDDLTVNISCRGYMVRLPEVFVDATPFERVDLLASKAQSPLPFDVSGQEFFPIHYSNDFDLRAVTTSAWRVIYDRLVDIQVGEQATSPFAWIRDGVKAGQPYAIPSCVLSKIQ